MDVRIHNVINRLKVAFPEAKFIVFGSHASGRQERDSDLDLCAVFSVLEKDPFEIAYDVRVEAQKYIDIPMDIFVVSEYDYNERRHEVGALEHIVATEGVAV